jgi:hypothetical protein
VLYKICIAHLLKGLSGGAFSAIPRCLKREYVRKRERKGDVVFLSSYLLTGNAETIQPYVLSACVTSKKEGEDATEDTAWP